MEHYYLLPEGKVPHRAPLGYSCIPRQGKCRVGCSFRDGRRHTQANERDIICFIKEGEILQ